MKKKRLTAMAVLLLCVFLSGCTPRLATLDSLMHPPKISGVNAEIQEAFEAAVPEKGIVLKTPTAGEYRSAYVVYDIDSDKENEVIIFYSYEKDKTVVHMHVLDKQDGAWVTVDDIKGAGGEVYRVDFGDMNSDGVPEIVVSWSLFESKGNKLLTVYGVQPEDTLSLRSVISEEFTQMISVDIDDDGADELLMILIDTTVEGSKSHVQILSMDRQGTVSKSGGISLTSAVSIIGLQAETTEAYGKKQVRIFIDEKINDTTAITEVVYVDEQNGSLVSPLTAQNSGVTPPTARSISLLSADINGDGRIEIPTSRKLAGGMTKNGEDTQTDVSLTVWSVPENGKLSVQSTCFMNYASSYMFAFKTAWLDKITLVNDVGERKCTFYRWDNKNKKQGAELFSLLAVPESEWKENPQEGYKLLKGSHTLVYAYKITQSGRAYGITEEILSEQLNPI